MKKKKKKIQRLQKNLQNYPACKELNTHSQLGITKISSKDCKTTKYLTEWQTADTDQTASSGCGPALFVDADFSEKLVYKILGQLLYNILRLY